MENNLMSDDLTDRGFCFGSVEICRDKTGTDNCPRTTANWTL